MATSPTPGTRAAGGIVAAYETEPEHAGDNFKALARAASEKDTHGLVWPDAPSEEEFEVLQRRLRRKIDARILPTLFVILVTNYLDRNGLSLARVQGIEKDLGMKGTNFNTAISILFVGYILGQVPSNLVLTRVRPSLYIPGFACLWGAVSACTAAADSYPHLVVIRFFLGITEAPFFPGILFFLSSWYTKKELALRVSILYTGAHLSGAFAGLIAAGIQNSLDGKRGLESWRWLFLIEGVITVFFALVAACILPDYPITTRWLSEKEKLVAVARLQRDTGVVDEETTTLWESVKAGAKDYKLWMMGLIYAFMTTAGGYTSFVPTVVNTFGHGRVKTLLLTAPPYLVPAVTELIVSFSSDRRPERCFHYSLPMLVGIVGFIIAATTRSIAPRYFSIFCMTFGMSSSFTVLLAWVGSTFARPRTKRAFAFGTVNALGNMAQIWSPYLYPAGSGPGYTMAFTINAVFTGMAIVLSVILRQCLKWENAKMDRDEAAGGEKRVRYVL